MIGSIGFSLYQNMGLVGILCIFVPKWSLGEKMSLGDSFMLLTMLYYLFFNVNSLTYTSMTTITQAKAVIYRLSEVFKMEEYHTSRQKSVDQDKPAITIENGQYSWGFRISEREEKMNKAKNHVKLAVETTQTSVLSNISIELMPKDLLVVVGKIGSGKTSLLNTIMDETVKQKGTHEFRGSIAYVEQ